MKTTRIVKVKQARRPLPAPIDTRTPSGKTLPY